MELNEASLGVFYISKCLALAPISAQFNDKGKIEIRRSILFTIYSFTFGITMVILAYRASVKTRNSKFPSLLASNTLQLVVVLDLTAVALTSFACIGCGLFSVKPTRELNVHLKKFDDLMYGGVNVKRDRLISRILATVPLMLGGALIGVDIWVITIQNDLKGKTETDESIFSAFYSLYFIIFGFHVLYANTAWALGRRFQRLNTLLKNYYLRENKLYSGVNENNKIIKVQSLSEQNRSYRSNVEPPFEKFDVQTQVDLLKKIAENYESLCICVNIFSNAFGLAGLFILVSSMLHTVATSYFIFLALIGGNDKIYIFLQSIWVTFHILRLLFVVEPCHMSGSESKQTIQIVAEIGRRVHDPVLAQEVKRFWKQLLITNAEITAIGVCSIDRSLLTSFSSSIATYIVILIQFQNVNQ